MSALTATISFNVTPLPDDDVWFLNAAAWSNYWGSIQGTVTINPAVTISYAPQTFDNTLPAHNLIIDGIERIMPSLAMFSSLVNQVAALDGNFQDLKNALANAGLITN